MLLRIFVAAGESVGRRRPRCSDLDEATIAEVSLAALQRTASIQLCDITDVRIFLHHLHALLMLHQHWTSMPDRLASQEIPR